MTIPALDGNHLPIGVYDCTFDELTNIFGYDPDRAGFIRKISDYILLLRKYGASGWIMVNGSFVTSSKSPGDIDIIVVMNRKAMGNQSAEDRCALQNLFDPEVAAIFGLDSIPGYADGATRDGFRNETEYVTYYMEYFTTVKYSDERKGILRIEL